MSLGLEISAKAAKAGVRAARKSMSRVLDHGQVRAKEVVDASGRRADDSLDLVERAVIGVLDAMAQRGQGYAKTAREKIYAAEARIFPRPRRAAIGTALVGVGAGVLVSLLLRPSAAAKPAAVGEARA